MVRGDFSRAAERVFISRRTGHQTFRGRSNPHFQRSRSAEPIQSTSRAHSSGNLPRTVTRGKEKVSGTTVYFHDRHIQAASDTVWSRSSSLKTARPLFARWPFRIQVLGQLDLARFSHRPAVPGGSLQPHIRLLREPRRSRVFPPHRCPNTNPRQLSENPISIGISIGKLHHNGYAASGMPSKSSVVNAARAVFSAFRTPSLQSPLPDSVSAS